MSSIFDPTDMKRTIFIFSAIAVCVFLLFRLSEYSVISSGSRSMNSRNPEILIVIAGCFFIAIGVFIHHLFFNRSTKESDSGTIDIEQVKKLGISNREHQILELMAKGMSNAEIGKQLHISENTVKSHVSNVLSKLNARRRTQAVRIARDLGILPL